MKKLIVFLAIFFTVSTVFAQFPFVTRYNNNGESFNGDYTIIGNTLWWNNGIQAYG